MYNSRFEEARLKAEDENVFAACGHDRATEAAANALKNMAEAVVDGNICVAAMLQFVVWYRGRCRQARRKWCEGGKSVYQMRNDRLVSHFNLNLLTRSTNPAQFRRSPKAVTSQSLEPWVQVRLHANTSTNHNADITMQGIINVGTSPVSPDVVVSLLYVAAITTSMQV